jgi:penicillin-binding protein 1A
MTQRSRRRHRRRGGLPSKLLFVGAAIIALLGILAIGVTTWVLDVAAKAPSLSSCKPVDKGGNSTIYAGDGSKLGIVASEEARTPVPLKRIPDDLRRATIAIEDQRFYEHGGIDPESILRAAVKDVEAGEAVEGGSTITQQLVRNLCIANPERSLERKIIEAKLAEEYAQRHSKDEILGQYLNTASYGTIGGSTAVGVQAASRIYFSRPVWRLSLAQAALLAGLPQAPTDYNPVLNPAGARERRDEVLSKMASLGFISGAAAKAARGQGLGLHVSQSFFTHRQPYFFDYVQNKLIAEYGVNTVRRGGLRVYTTIDPRLQEVGLEGMRSALPYPTDPSSALVAIDPRNGEIKAMVTSSSYDHSQFNLAAQAHRQPGSTFKAFVLTTALKQGIDPYTTYYDGTSPITLQLPGGGTWTVHNAEPGGGVMPLSEATWNSVNVIFAQLDLDVGPENVTHTAHQMGIEAPLESVPAEAIGGLAVGVTPLEMADAYATLADGGVHHAPTAISKVEFPSGKVDEPNAEAGDRVLTEGQAYDVTKLLEGVITQGTGAGYTYMGCPSEAGKTGTSEGLSDAWFVGYTPLFSTAVWVGHPQSREYTGFGGPTAGPIWRSFMESAAAGHCPEFKVPSSLPELSGLSSEHTRSSTEAAPKSGEAEEETGGKSKKGEAKEKEEGGAKEEHKTPEPQPEPQPTPSPPPTPAPPPQAGVGGGVAAPH